MATVSIVIQESIDRNDIDYIDKSCSLRHKPIRDIPATCFKSAHLFAYHLHGRSTLTSMRVGSQVLNLNIYADDNGALMGDMIYY